MSALRDMNDRFTTANFYYQVLRGAACAGLLAGALLAAPARAQTLFALDSGAGPGSPMRVHELAIGVCALGPNCTPTDMTGGTIGMRYGMPSTPGGGMALDEATGDRWLTPGPTLHRIHSGCANLDQWDSLNTLPPAAYFVLPSAQLAWTGLAFSRVPGKLFFTDYGRVAEVDIPPAGSSGVLPVIGLSYVDAPAPLVMPLTGVDYDPIDDTLWVLDSAHNLVHMDRPSLGAGVLGSFNLTPMYVAAFGAAPVLWCEGVAIDVLATPAGHPRGVISVIDGANRIVRVSTDGSLLSSCAMVGLPLQVVGLEQPLPKPKTYCTAKVNSCGSTPMMQFTGAPSAAATSGFVVSCVNAKANKPGLFLYGQTAASAPFGGGTLCVAAPISRTIGLTSGGTPPNCDGVLQIDFAAFAAGSLGGTPKAYLRVPGATVYVQAWGRDAPAAGYLLSNALEYVVHP